MRRPPPALLAGAAISGVLASGCGGGVISPDLFAVVRSGTVPGARLSMVVSDGGTVRCNGGPALKLSDPQLLQARYIQKTLHDPALKKLALASGPQPVLRYQVRTQDGVVSFSDDSSGQPAILFALALLIRQIAQQDCHLTR